MNEQNTREAAKRRTISEYRQGKSRGDYFAGDDEGALRVGFASGYDHGLDAGAASVDRAEIVREAFKALKTELGRPEGFGEGCEYFGFSVQEAMDAVLAEMEKGK